MSGMPVSGQHGNMILGTIGNESIREASDEEEEDDIKMLRRETSLSKKSSMTDQAFKRQKTGQFLKESEEVLLKDNMRATEQLTHSRGDSINEGLDKSPSTIIENAKVSSKQASPNIPKKVTNSTVFG
jgi:hypothetical protein